MPQATVHVLSKDELTAVSVSGVRQHRNPSACQNSGYGSFRPQELTVDVQSVQKACHRVFFCLCKTELHHQIGQMRFARIVQSKNPQDLFLREGNAKLCFQMVQPHVDFVHPQIMAELRQFTDRLRLRVIVIAKDMILSLFIPAGKLHPGDEAGTGSPRQEIPDDFTAFDGVMVGYRKQPDAGALYPVNKLFRCVCPVGNRCVYMQIHAFPVTHAFPHGFSLCLSACLSGASGRAVPAFCLL